MKTSKRLILNSTFALFIIIFGLLFVSCGTGNVNLANTDFPLGVWWWDNRLSDDYLYFARDNHVDEIYYYSSNFNQANADFIQKASQFNIDVYWLCGDYQWIDDYNLFYDKMEKFEKFQNENPNKFKGVHLDVEPHQHPNWDMDRESLITRYLDFVKMVTQKYDYIKFDFDLPFWLEDIVSFDGQTKEAFKFVIDYANRVFIMSYRDSAEKMFKVAKEELAYAKEHDKTIFLSAETGSEENIVTFYEEGKKYLYKQIRELGKLIDQNFGFAIHHIKSWYQLKI